MGAAPPPPPASWEAPILPSAPDTFGFESAPAHFDCGLAAAWLRIPALMAFPVASGWARANEDAAAPAMLAAVGLDDEEPLEWEPLEKRLGRAAKYSSILGEPSEVSKGRAEMGRHGSGSER